MAERGRGGFGGPATRPPNTVVLIPAGGIGARLGRRTPKQFLALGGGSILAATVAHFARHPAVCAIVVAAPAAHVNRAGLALRRVGRRGVITVVAGGPTRQESVWLALQAAPGDVDLVIVHDAVRPFITRRLIDAVVGAARRSGAAVCALPLSETVKRVRGDEVETTIDRSGLWTVQTPQVFRADLLREAHEKARRDGVVGTDDAALVERLGHPVKVVGGLPENLKITTPEDLRRARRMAL
jgi:2-C-methyl-D-erythritol 4-phosphate cytidylyltransferase